MYTVFFCITLITPIISLFAIITYPDINTENASHIREMATKDVSMLGSYNIETALCLERFLMRVMSDFHENVAPTVSVTELLIDWNNSCNTDEQFYFRHAISHVVSLLDAQDTEREETLVATKTQPDIKAYQASNCIRFNDRIDLDALYNRLHADGVVYSN